jgi:tetrahedral aminopeptidase
MTDDRLLNLLRTVCGIPGPTGHEAAVRDWLRTRWEPRMLAWQTDPVGNVLCRIGGEGPRLLIQAHMDEIGFVVRYITAEGFLLLDTAQGPRRQSPDRRYMVGQAAQVVGRHGVVAEGVFAAGTGHVLTGPQMDKGHIDYDDFFVDIGARSRAEAEERGVHVGAAVIWDWPVRRLGTRLAGKAMDDRMLLAVMDMLLDRIDPTQLRYDLWFGATVQEENGLHGARALGRLERFDAAIALDVGLVGDTPTTSEREFNTRLGGGPTLVHKDAGINYDKRLIWQLADLATTHAIPFEHGVFANFGSDAIAFLDAGIPAVLLAVPTRYTHSAFEMVEERDIYATVELLARFVVTPAPGVLY